MSSKKHIVLSGVAALAVALIAIAAITLSGTSPLQIGSTTTIGSGGTTTTTSPGAQPGTLAILLTDPPRVPNGVTAVYVTYSNLAVHVADAGNQSGWVRINTSGTVNLMGLLNVSQTISSAKIQSGKYNILRFNVTSAVVTYNGKNYTATMRNSMLTVPIIGGIEVDASKPSATIIDIQPTVFNVGSSSDAQFVINVVAKAYPMPPDEVKEPLLHAGFRMGLEGKVWLKDFREHSASRIEITSASLSTNSLSLTVKNTGNSSAKLRLVVVSPLQTLLVGETRPSLPIFAGSAVFLIKEDGSLQLMSQLTSGSERPPGEIFSGAGYTLASGSSATLKYTGQITLGFGLRTGQSMPELLLSNRYVITVIGDDVLATSVVVAH